ncbi:MAG: hypothetical protein M9945_14180 [Aquamicrobium sp.]|uniref:hypothetical protein n=1 Tax=Aquamicrobium sp. TaxID=1872579 RepID=UPI00349EC13A|nr:hypothetical protein [Aquamicrobium sp.]
MPDTPSVRMGIINRIKAAYEAVQPPADPMHVPTDADWPYAFSSVELGPLELEDHRKKHSVGIVPGPEKERFTFPFIECNFQVGVEFRITVNKNEEKPLIQAERMLTVVKRVVDVDRTWGGLAVDTKRTGNTIDLSSYGDKTVFGALFIEVMFRHSHLDPRDPHPDP